LDFDEKFSIDLIIIGPTSKDFSWLAGKVYQVDLDLVSIRSKVDDLIESSSADGFLFWDASLKIPNSELIRKLFLKSGDMWHAGLNLGMGGLPRTINYVAPTWMLNRDPSSEIEATSWRVSLRACLVKKEVLRQIEFIRPEFKSFEMAALEWGHRCISNGAMIRHTPQIISSSLNGEIAFHLDIDDELRFIRYRYGKKWLYWATLRSIVNGKSVIVDTIQACQKYSNLQKLPSNCQISNPLNSISNEIVTGKNDFRVTVLIPTIERYSFLEKLLDQLRKQIVPPHEIIIVDQTPPDLRNFKLYEDFGDLPLKVIFQDQSGQCSSRNNGLQTATGDHILFIDDDDEIEPDLIQLHIKNLMVTNSNVSSGVADEVGAGKLPQHFTYFRASDVFPTNNSLIKKSILLKSGLFDLAYNYGQRADGDLGMRIYLCGEVMVLNPDIRVFHHHAPRGGLRKHKARVITYASSRRKLNHFRLPSVTEIYLAKRYFSNEQLREMIWLAILGTFSFHGLRSQKILKIILGLLSLPKNIMIILAREKRAEKLLSKYPQIPHLQ
jgi:glycosyltransferase involved in cell wall biosynthesis